jgi:hypothetical protein
MSLADELQQFQLLLKLKELHGWDDDDKVWVAKLKAHNLEFHPTKSSKVKVKGEPKARKVMEDWKTVKVVKVKDFSAAYQKLGCIAEGEWVPDDPRGTILRQFLQERNCPWRRRICHVDGEAFYARVVQHSTGYHIQTSKPVAFYARVVQHSTGYHIQTSKPVGEYDDDEDEDEEGAEKNAGKEGEEEGADPPPASQKRQKAAPPQSEEAQGSGRPSRATKATPKAQESKSTGRKSKRARG